MLKQYSGRMNKGYSLIIILAGVGICLFGKPCSIDDSHTIILTMRYAAFAIIPLYLLYEQQYLENPLAVRYRTSPQTEGTQNFINSILSAVLFALVFQGVGTAIIYSRADVTKESIRIGDIVTVFFYEIILSLAVKDICCLLHNRILSAGIVLLAVLADFSYTIIHGYQKGFLLYWSFAVGSNPVIWIQQLLIILVLYISNIIFIWVKKDYV